MTGFRRNAQGEAELGSARVADVLKASGVATPAYFYDLDAMRAGARRIEDAFGAQPHLVAYAVKANSAGPVLRALFNEGVGADVVSGGELQLVLAAGVRADRVVMSGVAKTDQELDLAIAAEICAIQAESAEEIARIAARARAAKRRARVALRLNPGIEVDTHAHIATGHDAAKFGVPVVDLPAVFARIDAEADALLAVGLSTHIGSMQTTPEAYEASARRVAELVRARSESAAGMEYANFGGGFGVDYGQRPCSPPEDFIAVALKVAREARVAHLRVFVEPGRSFVAPHGILVARVVQPKVTSKARWLMLDAGMNDLLRPALYSAHHRIEPIDRAPGAGEWRVVGPVCESSDDFGIHPIGETAPEFVVIRDAGAYGYVMASEYNGRALPAEVFVSEGRVQSVIPSPGVEAWIARRLSS
ncbi:MAG: diaminopimelate decarboxylase [Myxococcota bacterium]